MSLPASYVDPIPLRCSVILLFLLNLGKKETVLLLLVRTAHASASVCCRSRYAVGSASQNAALVSFVEPTLLAAGQSISNELQDSHILRYCLG